jgi:hypothetical protein
MTAQRHRVLWFFAMYGCSLVVFAAFGLLMRLLLLWILR